MYFGVHRAHTHTHTHTHTPLSHRWWSEGVRASWGLCLSILWVTSLEPNFLLLISSSSSSPPPPPPPPPPSLLTWHSFITCRQGSCFTAIRMQVVHRSNLGRRSDSFSGTLSCLRFWCDVGAGRTLLCLREREKVYYSLGFVFVTLATDKLW